MRRDCDKAELMSSKKTVAAVHPLPYLQSFPFFLPGEWR
jgi:hypothetical protein